MRVNRGTQSAFLQRWRGEWSDMRELLTPALSKAIATLVRLGLESQEERKREFFKKLKANLADDDPAH
jgi:hypothetical protein